MRYAGAAELTYNKKIIFSCKNKLGDNVNYQKNISIKNNCAG